ncbi:GP46-like surface antigen, putative [Bodo saltans]|uniref:GP46-like surface antigen, putative n=1 Tax=Bodo saltans TaxID=75058 RepID=A0A0S4ILR7_BODSA|nr:GP46-like surface antigen, putative [Bodo saltans]|eukprot:CUE71697.1 GP46-like surface antigen, putative [Bodo saltans]
MLLFGLVLIANALAQDACECNSTSNRNVFLQAQNESGGASWASFARFDANESVCAWYGVTCSGPDVTAWVVGDDIGMTTLPDSLGNLPFLQTLVIRNQALVSGTLPSSWRGLKQITRLVIASCGNLTGELSNWVAHELTTLVDFRLIGLSLSGSLPAAYANLTNLTRLVFSSCNFSGSIPGGWFQLQRLEIFSVEHNFLTSTIPSWVGELSHLRKFAIGSNNISGTIPGGMNANGKLEFVDASRTLLSGTVPDWLIAAPMYYLDLSGCLFTGPLPSSENQSTMSVLLLNENGFSGTLPPSWGQMTMLSLFNISNQVLNELCGGVPSLWSEASALTNVSSSISDTVNQTCPMTVTTTKTFCPCDTAAFRSPMLSLYEDTCGSTCWAPYTRFVETRSLCSWYGVTCQPATGEGIDGFALSVSLNSVGMNGTLPERFADIGLGLESFAIYFEVNLAGTIPNSWSRLLGLRQFALAGNQLLSGSIPTWSWPHLQNLQLSSMPLFSGTIPSSLLAMSNLSYLYLIACNFSGTIPPFLGSLRNLQALQLASNPFTGTAFPPELSQLKKLRVFLISNCPLTGTIPRWFSSLTSLTNFNAYNTTISGTLPKFLPPALIVIQLAYSLVEGPLPPSWPITNPTLRRSWLYQEDSSKPHLCGGIPQSWLSWRNNSIVFSLNTTLVDMPCSPQNQSVTHSMTTSNSDCSNNITISVSGTFRNCSLDAVPCISMSSIIVTQVNTTVFVASSSIAYDTIVSQTTSNVQVPLNTAFPTSAGGESWPVVSVNLVSGRSGVAFFPDINVNRVTLSAPTNGWPISPTPYVTQVVRVGSISFQCATTTNTVKLELIVIPRSLPQIASAVSTTSTVAAWGSAISGSGSTASTTARVAAVQKLLLCLDDNAGSGGGLLGLAVGNDHLSSARGAIAGNLVIVVVSFVAMMSLAWVLSCFAWTKMLKILERMHGVSLLFPIFVATLPSSAGGIVRIILVQTGRDVAAWVLAFFGLVAWGGVLIALLWMSWSLHQFIQPISKAQTGIGFHSLRGALKRHTVWIDVNNTSKASGISKVAALHVILREYRVLWYPASEALLGAISGASTAATIDNDATFCRATSATLCAMYVVHLLITVWFSPFTTTFGLVYAALVGALSAMCVGFQIVFSMDDNALWAVRTSTGAAMAILGISYLRTLMDCGALLRGVNSLRNDLIREREERNTESSDVLSLHVMDQLHELNSQSFALPSRSSSPPSFIMPTVAHSSFSFQPDRSESSLRLSVVEAEFWDSSGNARIFQNKTPFADPTLLNQQS